MAGGDRGDCVECREVLARLVAAERADAVGLDAVAAELRRQALRWMEVDDAHHRTATS